MDFITLIFQEFLNIIRNEYQHINNLSHYKIYEENFRFNLYKTFINYGINNDNIIYEANFTNESIDKVDLLVKDNQDYFFEIKYNRGLENGNQLPFPMMLGKTINDLYKLSQSNINNGRKFLLYIFDEDFERYILDNHLDFLILSKINEDIYFSKDKFPQISKTFWNGIIMKNNNTLESYYLNFTIHSKDTLYLKNGRKLNIFLYEIF